MHRLAEVSDKVKDKIFIIPRVYTNKPRTKGVGYKGMLHQPDPNSSSDMFRGLIAIRKMHIIKSHEKYSFVINCCVYIYASGIPNAHSRKSKIL